jgi:predicted TIM-barrel fold metal-dependent hydrolase
MLRRTFLAAMAPTPQPVIDTHIHLFDPRRPQGIPWPKPDNKALYQPALPDRYRKLVAPHNVVGAVMVECSPWVEDNQWVLDTIRKEPIMVGMIGNLEPGQPDFAKHLDRFRKDPLFLGLRYGNLWDRDFHGAISKPAVLADIKRIADAGLTMDSANPTPQLVADLVRVTDAVPNLRLVVDHLPQIEPPADLAKLAQRPQVFIKISEVLRRVDGQVITDPAFYKARLDQLTGLFGPDRILFGSDWPNSDNWAPYAQGFELVKSYFAPKGPEAMAKYFARNSRAAYQWKPRTAAQRAL